MPNSEAETILTLDGLTKQYPGVLALDDFSISIRAGEVRALLGKNGAGKSTTIKILSGAIEPDSGTITIAGKRANLHGPLSALAQGISTVYQEISLIPSLTVAENILLGRWKKSKGLGGLLINPAEGRKFAAKALETLGITIDLDMPVNQLSIAQQQLVEIAKAISYDPKVLVLDEPTSALPAEQIGLLHSVVRTLSAQGKAVLYITHRLHEIPKIADSVTVLRDGRSMGTIPISEASPEKITEMIVGSDWKSLGFFGKRAKVGPVALSVRNLGTATKLHDISFDIHAGEVLGVAGLLSSGRTELLRAIFGLDPISSGKISVNGQLVTNLSPRKMKSLGVGLTAEDRKKEGLIHDFTILTNLTLAPVDRASHLGWLLPQKARQMAIEMVEKLDVKTPGLGTVAGSLSGGNQQKIVIGNWLNTQPSILLMDEPSRGIDVQAKEQIFKLVRELAKQGMAVLFISSEFEEVLDVCDRILVLHEGQITAEFDYDNATLEQLMAKAMEPFEAATDEVVL